MLELAKINHTIVLTPALNIYMGDQRVDITTYPPKLLAKKVFGTKYHNKLIALASTSRNKWSRVILQELGPHHIKVLATPNSVLHLLPIHYINKPFDYSYEINEIIIANEHGTLELYNKLGRSKHDKIVHGLPDFHIKSMEALNELKHSAPYDLYWWFNKERLELLNKGCIPALPPRRDMMLVYPNIQNLNIEFRPGTIAEPAGRKGIPIWYSEEDFKV